MESIINAERKEEEDNIALFKWRDNKFFTGLILGLMFLSLLSVILCCSLLIMTKGNTINRITCNHADPLATEPQGDGQGDAQGQGQVPTFQPPTRGTQATHHPPPSRTRWYETTEAETEAEGSGLSRLPNFGDQ